LTTVPGNKLTAGAHLRIQVETYNGLDDDRARTVAYGVNSFSLGAFASWKGSGITGCNSIGDIYCPNVYGREAISVYNSLNPGPNGKVLYPLAELDPTLSGRTFTLYLWDPGEGAESISIVGPNKTSLIPFSYTVSGGNGYAGNGVTSIDTSNSGCNPATRCPQPNNSTLSNGDKFNDRLITIKFQLPPEYTQEVTDTGNDWTYLQYKVGSSPSDRITYGLETGDSRTAPPHLVRWGS
jgi:hypothetical protein